MIAYILGLLFLIVLIGYLGYVYQCQARLDRLTSNWPGPRTLPIIGHLHLFMSLMGPRPFKRGAELVTAHFKDHRCKLWLGTKLYFVDCNPRDIHALVTAQQLLQKTSDYGVFKNWLGEGLFTSNVDKWMQHRKMIMPAFSYAMIRQFESVFERHARVLVERLDRVAGTEKRVEFFQYISSFTLDTICETALGPTVNSHADHKPEYCAAVREIVRIMDGRLKSLLCRTWLYPITALAAREKQVLKVLHGFTERIIKERLEQLSSDVANCNEGKNLCFLDTLLLARTTPEGEPLQVQDIREEVDTIIFGGYDLTAATLTFFVYNMTLHLDCQRQCREEILRVCGRHRETAISTDQLHELEYLEMCIKETLRMYPSAPIVARRATANCRINDFFIPKDSDVIISPFYMGRCAEFFPDPASFKPERWARDSEPKINASTFIPFMTGARSCLGKRYAMVMMKLVLAHLLRNFHFDAVGECQEKARIIFTITLHTRDPYYCILRAVENGS